MTNFRRIQAPITDIVVDDSSCEVDDLAYCGGVQVIVPATQGWDDLVARAVASDWVGIEALSAIPGTVGDAVCANVSAHGQAVADTVVSVRTWDRSVDAQRTFPLADCTFGSGTSAFQESLADGSERFQILDVAFLFRQGDLTTPIVEEGLARLMGIDVGNRVPLGAVREAVRR